MKEREREKKTRVLFYDRGAHVDPTPALYINQLDEKKNSYVFLADWSVSRIETGMALTAWDIFGKENQPS